MKGLRWTLSILILFWATAAFPAWEEMMETKVESADLKLYYEEYGAGDPVLCIHGFGARVFSWRYLKEALVPHYRLILLDLKGFGHSPKPEDEDYSVYDHAALVCRFIEEHNLKNLTIIGHSFGGGVAIVTSLYLAHKNSACQKALVLIDNVAYRQDFPLFIKVLRIPVIRTIGLAVVPSKLQALSILKLAYYDDAKIPDEAIAAYAEPLTMQGGKHALIKTAEKIIPADIDTLTAKYQEIAVPTLIIWGKEDEIIPLANGERLSAAMPRATFTVLNECGHIPQEEKPQETIEIIENFMSSVNSVR